MHVRNRPDGVDEHDIAVALVHGWDINATSVEYAPVGAGSYHWTVGDHEGQRWFATATDLDRSPWLGDSRRAALDRLHTAMNAALALRTAGRLRFVVAPVPTLDGATVKTVNPRYALALHPHIDGWSGEFEGGLAVPDQVTLAEMLAALHSCPPSTAPAGTHQLAVDDADTIAAALDEIADDRHAEATGGLMRALLKTHEPQLRRAVRRFRLLSERCFDGGRPLVITHGEPHPGNVMHADDRLFLIDWDTVGVALPERDLWMRAIHGEEPLRRYTERTGRPVDTDALALYELDWRLQEVAGPLRDLRSAEKEKTERARSELDTALTKLLSVSLRAP